MQKARGHTVIADMVLPLLVSRRFQVLFHSGPPVLFTFPSRYWFTIGHQVVFSFGRWSSQIPTRFHVPRGTRVPYWRAIYFAYRAFTLCGQSFQTVLLYMTFVTPCADCNRHHKVPQPRTYNACRLTYIRFELLPFRSPLLRESFLLSFPEGTKMFQFPSFASWTYVFSP
jgi:hypothetical protein